MSGDVTRTTRRAPERASAAAAYRCHGRVGNRLLALSLIPFLPKLDAFKPSDVFDLSEVPGGENPATPSPASRGSRKRPHDVATKGGTSRRVVLLLPPQTVREAVEGTTKSAAVKPRGRSWGQRGARETRARLPALQTQQHVRGGAARSGGPLRRPASSGIVGAAALFLQWWSDRAELSGKVSPGALSWLQPEWRGEGCGREAPRATGGPARPIPAH
jgi:hypothetical protein